MKLRAACALLFVLSSMAACLAQSPPLDIAFEGPWMFYREDFGGKKVLIAIAPNVPGHHLMTFSTGDGMQIPLGVYCLAFDDVTDCKLNATTMVSSTIDPEPVKLSRPNGFDWTTITNAYVIILPMPSSYASDAMHAVSFQDKFPTPTPTPTPSPAPISYENHSIALVWHYPQDTPQVVKLNRCTGAPSPATCNQFYAKQPNSATLHINIKSSDASDPCDYHVHRAYHKMIKLLESMGGMTTPGYRFIDVPDYRADCTPCDPQQELIPSDCSAMPMGEAVEAKMIARIPEELARLTTLLDSIPNDQKQRTRLRELKMAENNWPKKNWRDAPFPFMTLLELRNLETTLIRSENAINDLLLSSQGSVFKQRQPDFGLSPETLKTLGLAKEHEQMLRQLIPPVYTDAISGKNCRVTEVFVQ